MLQACGRHDSSKHLWQRAKSPLKKGVVDIQDTILCAEGQSECSSDGDLPTAGAGEATDSFELGKSDYLVAVEQVGGAYAVNSLTGDF